MPDPDTPVLSKPRSALRDFLAGEAAGGVLLILAAAVAMIIANTDWGDAYHHTSSRCRSVPPFLPLTVL